MHILKLDIKNFKRFETTSIDLTSKINILLGPNSSGKSSIIKALLAMKQTASPANENEALAAQGEYVDLGVYKDYVYNHQVGKKIGLCLTIANLTHNISNQVDPPITRFNITIGHDHVTQQARLFDIHINEGLGEDFYLNITKKKTRDSFNIVLSEKSAQLISERFRRGVLDEKLAFSSSWTTGISVRIDNQYKIEPDRPEDKNEFSLKHFPANLAKHVIGNVFKMLEKEVFYIGPLRKSPARSYSRTGHLLSVGAAGEHTPSVLANLKAQASKERSINPVHRGRLSQLENWMAALFPKIKVDTRSVEELVKLVISRGDTEGDAISDVGFGISQVLPILVQIAVMPDGSTLLIEQPELHLHPSVQTKLAEVIGSASKSGRRFIVETHSEHFVRGLQLAISENRVSRDSKTPKGLSRADVNFIYIPEAPKKPHTMEVNEWGEFESDWPSGFFDEAYKLATKLLENKMIANSHNSTQNK